MNPFKRQVFLPTAEDIRLLAEYLSGMVAGGHIDNAYKLLIGFGPIGVPIAVRMVTLHPEWGDFLVDHMAARVNGMNLCSIAQQNACKDWFDVATKAAADKEKVQPKAAS